MSDPCADGRSKMHHITHVLSNILRLFASYENLRFNVAVDAFNEEIHKVFNFVHITQENVNEYINKIQTIYPQGQTNLLLPIQTTMEKMALRKTEFPSNKRLHFLLTDGVDTCRNTPAKIIDAVTPDYDTIIFGFGIHHDSKTLSAIGENLYCEYAFIAELEKAGIVYGEYIHNVLYRCIEGVTILPNNAEMYCWEKNTWSSSLYVENLTSGVTKTYYIRTANSENTVCVEVYGRECSIDDTIEFTKLDENAPMPYLIDESSGEIDTIVDFAHHAFRYKTLELLYEIAHIDDYSEDEPIEDDIPSYTPMKLVGCVNLFRYKPSNNDVKKRNALKEKLRELYRNIRDYKVATYGELGNAFLETLMDDVYVARRSLDHKNGRIYAVGRQKTQGTQNVYSPGNINDLFCSSRYNFTYGLKSTAKSLNLSNTHSLNGMNNIDDESDFLNHTISSNTIDDNATPRMLDIIHSTSENVQGDDENV
jgi:hypothetical protein